MCPRLSPCVCLRARQLMHFLNTSQESCRGITALKLLEKGGGGRQIERERGSTCAKNSKINMRDAWFCPLLLLPPDEVTLECFLCDCKYKGWRRDTWKGKRWTDDCDHTFARCYIKPEDDQHWEGMEALFLLQCVFSFIWGYDQEYTTEMKTTT